MTELTPIAQINPVTTVTSGRGKTTPPQKRALTKHQKAAVIVRFLLNEGAEVPLAQLPEDMQSSLTQQMGAMRYIDRATLATVVGEFADELEAMGLTFPRGLADALVALDGTISPQTAARLKKEAGVRQIGDPWEMIRGLDFDALLPIIEQESTEVAAVLLSKLPVAKAAELLGKLPGPRARRITYAISLTGAVTPDAVDRIGISLASQFDTQPLRAFEEDPVDRLGAILNISPSNTRDEVLIGLAEDDAGFADKVRKAIFTFVHIPARMNVVDVPKITRDVDQPVLVAALAFGLMDDGDLKVTSEFILENISKRMSETLREEIGEVGKIKAKDGEDAMNQVVSAIRALQANGEIQLIVEEDGEEEE